MIIVGDLESDELLDKITKIYCFCYTDIETGEERNLITYEDIISLFQTPNLVWIGHNIQRYDVPAIEKILGISITCKLIDTLGISYYLYPDRLKHGLEYYGEDFGIPKPKIDDWFNLSIEEYVHRCREDVKINTRLFLEQKDYLNQLYDGDENQINRILGYIRFKLDCAREQEELGWKLDYEFAVKSKEELQLLYDEKFIELSKAMPTDKTYKNNLKPDKMLKKDGTFSEAGKKWLKLLEEHNKPENFDGVIQTISKEEVGNPGSNTQLKNWLFSLGWNPCTFEYRKVMKKKVWTGEIKKVPQINDDGKIVPSVKILFEKEPSLELLEGITILNHRLGILKGFLSNCDENHYLKAKIQGFTNTMRFKHTEIVNLPKVFTKYGNIPRGCLICEDNQLLCGSDMSSLEDNTKQHYMYFYDPEYVREMRIPGFSPHLDIGVQGDMITKDESNFYIWYDARKSKDTVVEEIYFPQVLQKYLDLSLEEQAKEIKRISEIRGNAKQVNFSAVYGVGAPKLSLGTGWTLTKSKGLLDIYWKRNWSVKQVARDCIVKTVYNQTWLWNPVAQFWYYLKADKDRFSTLNQGTGVYCFDTWVRKVRSKGIKICGQFHDEIIAPLLEQDKEIIEKKLKEAIKETNEELRLNIELGISIDFGKKYSEIH